MSERNKQIESERVPLLIRNQDEAVDKYSGASFYASVFNLSCSIAGAGIMSLPATLRLLGLVPGVTLIIFAAFLTEASIEMLLRFSKPGSAFSYGDVMGDAFGMMGKMLLQTTIVINNIGAVIIYLIMIEDLLSGATSGGVHHEGVLEEWFGEHWWTGRAFVLIALTVIVFVPLLCFKRIESLRYTSAISFALAVVFLIVLIGITIYKLAEGSIETPRWFPTATDFTSFCNLFTAVPPVVGAYVCHFNGMKADHSSATSPLARTFVFLISTTFAVHSIENELERPLRMQVVVRTSLALCTIVYVMTGSFGFLLFGDSTLSDVLSNFDSDLGIPYSRLINDIVRVSYACHIIFIFPIIFYPLRLNLDGLLFSSTRPLASNNLRFALINAVLIIIVLLGAIFIPSIWVAFQFSAATVGILLGFIFPASITLKDSHGIATRTDKILSVLMIIVAVFANVVAIYSNAYSLSNGTS